MKHIFCSILIINVFTCCNSQRLPSIPSGSLLAKDIIKDTAIALDFNAERRMTVFADSLNYLSKEASLPSFLYYECFDWKTEYWPDMHHPVSLRQIIVNKVTNKAAIERILKADDLSLRKTCDVKSSLAMPDSQKSFYVLFKLRYAELK
jgi:hypothetical protein